MNWTDLDFIRSNYDPRNDWPNEDQPTVTFAEHTLYKELLKLIARVEALEAALAEKQGDK